MFGNICCAGGINDEYKYLQGDVKNLLFFIHLCGNGMSFF